MGAKITRKLLAVMITVALLMTSGVGVFAAGSNTNGKKTAYNTEVYYGSKSIKINNAGDTIKYKLKSAKKWKTVKTSNGSATLKNLKKKGLYIIKNGKNTSYRYIAKNKIKKAKGKKGKATISWKKFKGASKYEIIATCGSTTKKFKTSKLSKTIKLKKGKWTIMVRPIKKSGKKNYTGQWSKAKTVKVK